MTEPETHIEAQTADHRRRRVLRTATAYALVSWVLLQLGEITFEPLKLPEWSLTALIWFLVLGFPVVVILAWLFESGERGLRFVPGASLGKTLALLLGVVALDALAGRWLYQYYLYEQPQETARAAAGADPGATPQGVTTAPPNSIAVLPFVDMSPQGDQQYFSDGITEEILNVLARVDGLMVVSRTSSFALRDRDRDVREIGRLLNVANVLEGSIRKDGESIRVTAQLIDASNGFHLWTNHFDRRLEDILEIQDEIAGEIVRELLGSVEALATAPKARETGIASFEAYDLYLQGRELWQRRTPASLNQAVAVFERTLEMDPAYALAYSGLADAYLLLANYGNLSVADAVARATPLIQTALELDGQLSEGFASLGLMYWHLGRFAAAEGHLRRAVKLDPENMVASLWLGTLIGSQGRLGEEMALLKVALEKDPLNPLININIASNRLRAGQREVGIGHLEQMLEIYPTSTLVLRTLASWYAAYGDLARAFDYLDRALAIAPDEPTVLALQTDLLLDLGEVEGARGSLSGALNVGPENAQVVAARARFLIRAGRLEELRDLARAQRESLGDAVVTNQASLLPEFWLGLSSLLEGDPETAAKHFDQLVGHTGVLQPPFDAESLTWSAVAHDGFGDREGSERLLAEAERIVRQLRLQGFGEPRLDFLQACLDALKGDLDAALDALATASSHGWIDPWQAAHDPRLNRLHGDPRFDAWLGTLQQRQDHLRGQLAPVSLAAR